MYLVFFVNSFVNKCIHSFCEKKCRLGSQVCYATFVAIDMHSTGPSTFRRNAATTALGHFTLPVVKKAYMICTEVARSCCKAFIFHLMTGHDVCTLSLEHEFPSTTSSGVKLTQNRACCKMLQKAARKKRRVNRLCTHCIPGYLYREEKRCRLHVSAW
ncbi:hypothetical protein XENOCAPTIV_029719 [Xenoophorus captivus]|uniref:Secreted protein n=1 Tax=Xenoophorus captivus TaxID=1517983 RepID=A0ABV0Q6T4_9TELE